MLCNILQVFTLAAFGADTRIDSAKYVVISPGLYLEWINDSFDGSL